MTTLIALIHVTTATVCKYCQKSQNFSTFVAESLKCCYAKVISSNTQKTLHLGEGGRLLNTGRLTERGR